MSWTSHVFAGTGEPVSSVREALEAALGGTFAHPAEEGEDPYLVHDRADIYVGPHDYDDDVITFADGSWVRLHSQYPHSIEVRDIDKDIERQQALARRIFEALKALHRWRLVYIDDMQQVIDTYDPADTDG
jgi:hypothetical protein